MSLQAQWNGFVATVEPVVESVFEGLKPHPNTAGLPLTDLNSLLMFEAGYFLMLLVLIPIMKSVKTPFKLKGFKLFHNVFLWGLSGYMCAETIRQAYLGNYKLFGNDLEKGDEPHAKGMATVVWIFYVSKFAEFVDTLIMILCKKFNQVSFLHCYHHSTIAAIWWAIARWAPGGDAYFSVILNSGVHFVMYAYYALSSQGYTFLQPIKPYITTMQMTQFMCMLVQSLYDYMYPCDYPQVLVKLLGVYMLTLLALFGNFFIQSYLKKPASKKAKNL